MKDKSGKIKGVSKKAWLTNMFFHNNNESSVSKVKHLISNFKKSNLTKDRSIRNSLAELNGLVEEIQKIILESNIDRREGISLLIGKLLFACNFDRAIRVIHSIPKKGLRWGRISALGAVLSIIMIFFIIL